MGRRGLFAAAAALVVMVPATSASAGERIDATFGLEASNGYDLRFRGVERQHQHTATIAVRKGDASASYHVTSETITARRIVASFGDFGEIDVRFRPRGASGGGRCHPYRAGMFSGTIRFDGEDDYTAVDEFRAQGKVARPPSGFCIPGLPFRGDEGPPPKLTSLFSCDPARDILYLALAGLGPRPVHSAIAFARVGKVRIIRGATGEGPVRSFRFRKDQSAATVSPGSPFSGVGRYSDHHLQGSLSVLLPGIASPIPLAASRADLSNEGDVPPACDKLLTEIYSGTPGYADHGDRLRP